MLYYLYSNLFEYYYIWFFSVLKDFSHPYYQVSHTSFFINHCLIYFILYSYCNRDNRYFIKDIINITLYHLITYSNFYHIYTDDQIYFIEDIREITNKDVFVVYFWLYLYILYITRNEFGFLIFNRNNIYVNVNVIILPICFKSLINFCLDSNIA